MKPLSDIDAIRRSLGIEARDEEILRDAAPLLEREIHGWVTAFYARLQRDPSAAPLLADDGTVEHLRRSLAAWFREMFSLPLDDAYERARAQIGRTHVRVGMPLHLMVTAMAGIRFDVRDACRRIWVREPERAERVSRVVERVLDLELALMLLAFGRHALELAQRRDRALLPLRVARRLSVTARNGVDAALCYVDLARRAPDAASRERWLARVEAELEGVARVDRRGFEGLAPRETEAVETDLEALAMAASGRVSLPASTNLDLRVEPRHARAVVYPGPLRLALAELLQNAVNHDPGGTAVLSVRAGPAEVVVEVTDGGPGWPPGVASVADLVATSGGMGLAYGEHVAELHGGSMDLFPAPGHGAGVRLHLPVAPARPASGPA